MREDVEAIAPERDSNNNAVQKKLPGVLPNEIVNKRPQIINALIQTHFNRLRSEYTVAEIAESEVAFVKLRRRICREEGAVTAAIDAIEGDGKVWEFEKCLECIARTRAPLLYEFFGGLATIFPGTATVEAYFSDLSGQRMSTVHLAMSDFSLEAKLHARQFDVLQSL